MKIHENVPRSVSMQIQKVLDMLNHLNGTILVPRGSGDDVFDYSPLMDYVGDNLTANDATIYRLVRVKSDKAVVGVDSSVIPIAESIDGFVLAVKGCIVAERAHSFETLLLGPYPIYISDKNINTLMREFRIAKEALRRAPYEISAAKQLSIEIIEKLLLTITFNYINDSIVLIDGPLTRITNVHRCLADYSNINNVVVGFVKRSKVVKRFPFIFKLILSLGYECAIELPWPQNGPIKSLVVLLAKGGLPFRVEILNNGAHVKDVLDIIYSSAITSIGYPEVLRCAHIFSRISRLEIITLIGLMEKYGAKYVTCEKLRDMLFGPFNKHLVGDVNDSL